MKNKEHNIEEYKKLGRYLVKHCDILPLVDLANINDFFMYLALDCINGSNVIEAKELIALFEFLETDATYGGNRLYAGFFFALVQLLSLKFEITKIKGELISKNDFIRSFRGTLRKMGFDSDDFACLK